MKGLSTIEVELLHAVISEPDRTLTYYGDQLRKSHTHLTRALEKLVSYGYVDRTNNRLTISDKFRKETEQKAQQEAAQPAPEPTVVDSPEPEPVAEKVTVTELAPMIVEIPEEEVEPETVAEESAFENIKSALDELQGATPPFTSMEVQRLLADGTPRNALKIAKHFGYKKGTQVAQKLRTLCAANVLVKAGSLYLLKHKANIATKPRESEPEPEPAIEKTEVKFTTYIHELNDEDLRDAILRIREPFTASHCLSLLSRKHKLDADSFLRVFADVADSGALLCWDKEQFVDPKQEYAPDLTFVVECVADVSDQVKIMDAYCGTTPEPYNIFDIVSATRLRPVDILKYLHNMQFFVNDTKKIVSGRVAERVVRPRNKAKMERTPFAQIGDLDPIAINDFIYGGVKLDVFLRKFNLDPAQRDNILEVLRITNVALYNVNNDWLFTPPELTKLPEPEPETLTDHEIQVSSIGPLHITAPARPLTTRGQICHEWTAEEIERFKKALENVAEEEGRKPIIDTDPVVFVSPELAEPIGVKVGELPHENADGSLEIPVMQSGKIVMEVAEYEKAKEAGANITLCELIPGTNNAYVWINGLPIPATESTEEPEQEPESESFDDYLVKQVALGDEIPPDEFGRMVDKFVNSLARAEDVTTDAPACDKCNRENCLCKYYVKGDKFGQPLVSAGISLEEGKERFEGFGPNPQWLTTLQMLEERLRFEHQSTGANQLKEIREYLETR